jgi:hypothetical protein
MSEISPRLSLPLIQPAQAQKHVTHNEAIDQLDVLVQLVAEAFDAVSPPAVPAQGAVWLLGGSPTGDWAGQGGMMASWRNGGWRFIAPQEGWRAWDRSAGVLRVLGTAGWMEVGGVVPDLQNLAGLGIGTTSDAVNLLAVAGEASLFTHGGAGHQIKVNKAAAADTVSLLFQSGFSGRAEMGLAGSDDFSVKVSADGTTFREALRTDAVTGRVTAPNGMTVQGTITGTAVTQSATDATPARLMQVGDFGLGTPIGVSQPTVSLGTALIPGQYSYLSSDPQSPSPNSGMVVVMRYASQSIRQEATPAAIDLRFQRFSLNEGITWSPWRPVYTSANILGTVAQSAGVPTGAVIEQGSNANGSYTRFADGTQICVLPASPTLSCSEVYGALFRSLTEGTWTFPVAFSAVASLAVSGGVASSGRWVNVRRDTATRALYRHYSAVSSGTGVATSLLAVGRWF